MFPIRDHNPSLTTPYVTLGLIVLNVAIFLSYWPFMTSEAELTRFFYQWGMVPRRISEGSGYFTILTSMFMHAGWAHVFGNMLFLWIFGDNLEGEMGHVGFLLFYLACGIGAALTHLTFAPLSTVPTVGASGAIAGVMGGYLLLYPRARVDVLVILIFFFQVYALPAWTMLGLWFVMQLASGIGADPNVGGVAYWAHTGGFLIGVALTVPIWLRKGHTHHWGDTQGRPPFPPAEYRIGRSDIPRVRRRK